MGASFTAWQPIATAPRDGTRVLITDGLECWISCWKHRQYFENGRLISEIEEWVDRSSFGTDLTHWMPLPDMPEVSGA